MNPEPKVSLFSYGTLQLPNVQRALFGRLLEGRPDAMLGYHQAWTEITDPEVIEKSGTARHPIVTRTDNPVDKTVGTVFMITEDEPAAADAYEVADYGRVQVHLQSGTVAWVYVSAAAASAVVEDR